MKIALIEDHAIIRTGLRLLLEAEGHLVVAEYGTAAQTLLGLPQVQPDLAILDLNLPDAPGLQIIEPLRKVCKVLVLSMHEEADYVAAAFERGASGYLPKRAADRELIDAVSTVNMGQRYLHSSLVEALALTWGKPSLAELSKQEKQVVGLIAKGYNLSQAAEQMQISVKTAATYKSRALDKLGLVSVPDLVNWARQHGLS